MLSAAGRSCKEENHTLWAPERFAKKWSTGILARLTEKMPVLLLAKLFGRVHAAERPFKPMAGAVCMPASKDAACWQ